jgi:hypothetical protein
MNAASPSQLPSCQPRQPDPAPANFFVRLLHKIASVISEMNDANRRIAIRRASLDMYLNRPDAAPDTYEEFLVRSRGPKFCEPTASARARGRLVR